MPDTGDGCDIELPFVTIVMPIRDEERSIGASLTAVLRQDYPASRLEVVIADGMSRDATRAAIDEAVDRAGPDGPAVAVVENPAGSAPAGLNLALAAAKGDVIVRVDGHCTIQADFVSRCVRLLDETGAANVGGAVVAVAPGDGPWPRAIALAMTSSFGAGGARFRRATRAGWVDTVYLGAWPRVVFERVGLFDEDLVRNQDDEHNLRIVQSGRRIWLDPTIATPLEARGTIGSLWRQYFEFGLYKVLVIRKRRAVASWRPVVPAAFVVSLVATATAGTLTRRPKLAVAVAAPYALASAVASIVVARRDRGSLTRLPVVFATLHFGYGAGFLAGLWKWRRFPRS